jgi:MFS family permease
VEEWKNDIFPTFHSSNNITFKEKIMQALNVKATKTWVLVLTSAASFMAILDAMVVTTALSTIRLDLGTSIEALQWVVNAFNLSFAVLLLTGTALGDRFGRRRMFALGLSLFVAASAACALAGSIGWLIAARAVQGAGAALVTLTHANMVRVV